MKTLAGFVSVFVVGLSASAAVPYGQLENLRRQTVVTRVALDNPEDALIKTCGIKTENLATLGANLSLAMDEAAEKWSKKTLREADLATLKPKIAICATRGSCQVYEKYLSSVKIDEAIHSQVANLTKLLNKKLESTEAAAYKKALHTVPEPCEILKTLKNKN